MVASVRHAGRDSLFARPAQVRPIRELGAFSQRGCHLQTAEIRTAAYGSLTLRRSKHIQRDCTSDRQFHLSEVVAMARSATQRGTLSIGQLARRWGLGADRVRRLVESGLLPGSFKVPSAGKYGEAVRIPLSAILQAEKDWAIPDHCQAQTDRPPRRRRRGSLPELAHLPELSHEHDDGCREADQH